MPTLKPFFQDENCIIYNASSYDIILHLEEQFDSVITDPPYGIDVSTWDYDVPSLRFWRNVRRMAKPGALLLSFGGPRTFHRLACEIDDAGWEIKDCISWLYGCLSDDTEVLTRDGWERYHTAKRKEILAYDPQADVYQWEKPERWSAYRVEQDTAYRIKSDTTDQIVSRNHRCLVERCGSLTFVAAEECAGVERVPYLQCDLSALPQGRRSLLLQAVLRQGEGLAETALCERQGQDATGHRAGWPEEPGMEGRADLLQAEGQVRQPVDQVRSMSCGVCGDGASGWLRRGASVTSGHGDGAAAVAERVRTSRQPRRDGQPTGEPDAVRVERGSQAARTRTSYQISLATVTPIAYSGLIFCPTVSTGAFVARRNGKVFITGNSGFPKSLDISKAVDKQLGAEREKVQTPVVVSTKFTNDKESIRPWIKRAVELGYHEHDGDVPASPEGELWHGWKTTLKPAWEPIIVAMNPLHGSFAENALNYGVAGFNVEEARIESEERPDKVPAMSTDSANPITLADSGFMGGTKIIGTTTRGRLPTNVIIDEDAAKILEEQKEGASRFFYCAKVTTGRGKMNSHPTVKPLSLMRYLCTLTKTPTGGTVLDPFAGSGTTLVAALECGRKAIGIEIDRHYCEIAAKRVVDFFRKNRS